MNKQTSDLIQQRIVGLKGAVESFEMFDSHGNCCAAALFKLDNDQFELSLWHFNSAVSINYRGPLAVMKNRMNLFFETKQSQGFTCATEPPQFPPKN